MEVDSNRAFGRRETDKRLTLLSNSCALIMTICTISVRVWEWPVSFNRAFRVLVAVATDSGALLSKVSG